MTVPTTPPAPTATADAVPRHRCAREPSARACVRVRARACACACVRVYRRRPGRAA
ncbi:hypothetical protein SUDANB106_02771 [Streptomyces sp. enrichment culture]